MTSGWPGGLHHNGMHDFIITEALLGTRVAHAQDNEDTGFGALFDLSYVEWCREDSTRRMLEQRAENDLTLDIQQVPTPSLIRADWELGLGPTGPLSR